MDGTLNFAAKWVVKKHGQISNAFSFSFLRVTILVTDKEKKIGARLYYTYVFSDKSCKFLKWTFKIFLFARKMHENGPNLSFFYVLVFSFSHLFQHMLKKVRENVYGE